MAAAGEDFMVNYIGTINNDDLDHRLSVTDDLLDGLQGADIMRGGDGNDTYIVDNLGDVVEEFFDDVTSGYDTVQSSVSFTLSYGIDRLILTGSGSNSGTGNALDNDIQGNSGDNTLLGLDGNDIIDGGSGSDTLFGDSNNDGLGGGDDTLKGGLGNDTLDGESGSDTADYSDKTLGVTVVLDGAIVSTVFVDGIAEDTVVNIENITGCSGNDTITGDGNANTLNGNGGNDTISGGNGIDIINGGDGDDTINGGASIDTINGGNGNDTLLLIGTSFGDNIDGGADIDTLDLSGVGAGIAHSVDLAAGTWQENAFDIWTIVNVENVTGSDFDNTITGDGNANTLNGNDGSDTHFGRRGHRHHQWRRRRRHDHRRLPGRYCQWRQRQ